MKASKYLGQVREIKMRIDSLERSIQRIDDLLLTAGVTDYTKERVMGGSSGNKTEDNIIKRQEYEEKLQLLCAKGIELLSDIIDRLADMDPLHAAILEMHYIGNLDFEDIARELCYTVGYIYHKHNEAKKAFQEKYLKK